MRILGGKFFGGKIRIFNKGWQIFFFLNWRMRILGPRIFSKFLAGKLEKLKWVILRVNLGSQEKFWQTLNKQEKLILFKTHSTEYVRKNSTLLLHFL